MFNNNGYVINIDKNGYGKDYYEDEKNRVIVNNGDYFILSNYEYEEDKVILIQIDFNNDEKYIVIIEEIKKRNSENKEDKIFNYINENIKI